jgi:hypothetical protein
VNSQWSSGRASRALALLLILVAPGCGTKDKKVGTSRAEGPPADPAQAEAELLGREAADIIDRVLAYKSSHEGRLPVSLRQAGIDSLTPQFIRRLSLRGQEPSLLIIFRRTSGHQLASCIGDRDMLEDKLLNAGSFQVVCDLIAGGRRTFTIVPPPPPPKTSQ